MKKDGDECALGDFCLQDRNVISYVGNVSKSLLQWMDARSEFLLSFSLQLYHVRLAHDYTSTDSSGSMYPSSLLFVIVNCNLSFSSCCFCPTVTYFQVSRSCYAHLSRLSSFLRLEFLSPLQSSSFLRSPGQVSQSITLFLSLRILNSACLVSCWDFDSL